ncbi:MAG: hypothetical protein KAZ17_03165, partial [Sphingorhabdus sp.]|nr:hypothetical protein [Sphingorhabdus sp.]
MSEEQANPEDGNAPINIDAANAAEAPMHSGPALVQPATVKRNDWASKLTLTIAAAAALWGLAGPLGSGIGLWNFGFAING